jgi:hypothetical protein
MDRTNDCTTAPTPSREICYDTTTKDYAMHLDGSLVGFARTYYDAEATLDALVSQMAAGDPGDYDDTPTDAPGGDSPETGPSERAPRFDGTRASYLARARWAQARWENHHAA